MADENNNLPSLRDIVISQVKERDDKKCRNCGFDEKLVVDSVVSIEDGGNKTTENLVTLCQSCKNSKDSDDRRYNQNYPDNWGNFKKKVYERDSYDCQNCGLSGGSERHADAVLNAHHIVPKSVDGNDTISNCVTLCKDCHAACHSHMSSPLEPTTRREDTNTVEFTGTVVQAGDPIVLDNRGETRQVETDAELCLGEEVTVWGTAENGSTAEDGIIEAEQIDVKSEKSITEHGQSNTSLEDNDTGTQTTSSSAKAQIYCNNCESEIDWKEHSNTGKCEGCDAEFRYKDQRIKMLKEPTNSVDSDNDSDDSDNSPTFEDTDVEFTGTVVQAGAPIILDNGTETRQVETDAELRLGEEVTVRGTAEDGKINADDVF